MEVHLVRYCNLYMWIHNNYIKLNAEQTRKIIPREKEIKVTTKILRYMRANKWSNRNPREREKLQPKELHRYNETEHPDPDKRIVASSPLLNYYKFHIQKKKKNSQN